MKIKNKTILLLGATGYVGKQLAKKLIDSGYFIIVHGRNKKKVDLIKSELGNNCIDSIIFDFIKDDLDNFTLEHKLFGIINTVGIPGKHNSFNVSEWTKTFLVNAIVPYGLILKLFPNIIDRGSIIILSSALTNCIKHKGYIGQDDYIISKTALNSATGILSVKANGIFRINIIAPSFIDGSNFRKKKIKNTNIDSIIKRNCNFDDIAGLVLFLLSDESKYITGETFILDGKRKY